MFNQKNTVPEDKKNTAIKTLAIIGVIALIFLTVWVLVQAIRFAPNAFYSLASIADGLYNTETEFTVSTNKSVVNTGEPFFVTWSTVNREGTYYFSYACAEGVSAEARDAFGAIVFLTCETPFALEDETDSVEVIFESEKERFADVAYRVTFVRDGEEASLYDDSNLVTVVNASITQSSEVAATNGEDDDDADNTDTTDGSVAGAATGGGTGGGVVRTVPVTNTYYPTSDPNGTVDLKVTYLGIGSLNDDNEFTPRGDLDNDRRGAIRFEVRNIGTKTSDEWEFEAELPTSPASTYNSPDQTELRPNERAVVTVGFDNLGNPRIEDFEVTVEGGGDDNESNNSFEWAAEIVS